MTKARPAAVTVRARPEAVWNTRRITKLWAPEPRLSNDSGRRGRTGALRRGLQCWTNAPSLQRSPRRPAAADQPVVGAADAAQRQIPRGPGRAFGARSRARHRRP